MNKFKMNFLTLVSAICFSMVWPVFSNEPSMGMSLMESGGLRCKGRAFKLMTIPESLKGFNTYPLERGDKAKPGQGTTVTLSESAVVYLAVMDRGGPSFDPSWEKTDMKMEWMGDHVPFVDVIYKKTAPAGKLEVPEHKGKFKRTYGVPNMLIVPPTVKVKGLTAKIEEKRKQPNIIFILADDLGWADTTLYGHTKLYQTPNIERLAKRGMTFSRAYANSPLCSPTRASILTGQIPLRHGSTRPEHHLKTVQMTPSLKKNTPSGEKAIKVKTANRLDTNLPTLGKLLKSAGYTTGHFGKWHLGHKPYSPLEHGFDVDIPHHHGPGPAGSYVAPWRYKNFKANSPKEHIEDRMAEEAIAWMKSVKDKGPFFMNYWQFSVHGPWNAKQELVEKYKKLIKPGDRQQSAIYAAMIESMDDAIGSLLDAVDEAGIADETVLIFVSDNGGNMYSKLDGIFQRTITPLRGGKGSMCEGGIRVPCVVAWPGITKKATRSEEIIQTSDFYPTILNQLGIQIPSDHKVDGLDISPALAGEKIHRKGIITYFPDHAMVPDWVPTAISLHSGDWKLLRLFHQGEKGAHDYLLYNLTEDIGEKNNLADQYPERVKAMDLVLENAIQETGGLVPVPNPNFDPAQYRPEQIGKPTAEFMKKHWKTSKKSGAGQAK